ncbi:MAG: hypothetical protein WA777_02845 [Rhodanobacter sp.]
MPICRPIGHIAGNLTFAAISISMRVKHSTHDAVHVCWLADDGCLYLQQAGHASTRAIERHAPEQIMMRYRKQPNFTWRDIQNDLIQARAEFAERALAEAIAA